MILADTSVWIDLFNHPHSLYAQELRDLIEKDEDICLADIIITEILQGIKDDRVFDQVREYLVKFPIFKAASLETYIQAANIYRLCRRKGKTISKTVDAIIASLAIEHNLTVFSKDKDFDLIAECSGLKVLKPEDFRNA